MITERIFSWYLTDVLVHLCALTHKISNCCSHTCDHIKTACFKYYINMKTCGFVDGGRVEYLKMNSDS